MHNVASARADHYRQLASEIRAAATDMKACEASLALIRLALFYEQRALNLSIRIGHAYRPGAHSALAIEV